MPASLSLQPSTAADLQIGAVKYKNGVLQLNANTHITGIAPDVWDYRIGGYQVLDKWFKSHKGAVITKKSLEHIMNMVGLLAETIKIRNGMCADSNG